MENLRLYHFKNILLKEKIFFSIILGNYVSFMFIGSHKMHYKYYSESKSLIDFS